MGYTHYWELQRPLTAIEITNLAGDIRAIVQASGVPIAGGMREGAPEYGPTRIWLNGLGDGGCETFGLSIDGVGFDFCKTRQKPYDVVVTAALLVLKDRVGDAVRLNSDGEPSDWVAGQRLAERALSRSIPAFVSEPTV